MADRLFNDENCEEDLGYFRTGDRTLRLWRMMSVSVSNGELDGTKDFEPRISPPSCVCHEGRMRMDVVRTWTVDGDLPVCED